MVDIKDIPAEVRWEIATKAANSQSVVCDMLERQIIGNKIDEIWKVIMAGGGKESRAMAEFLGLPARNAAEIDNAIGIFSTIIMGPELEGYVLEADEDHLIGKMTNCPMLNVHRSVGHGPTAGTPDHCQTFGQSAVESLNPRYTMRYTKRM